MVLAKKHLKSLFKVCLVKCNLTGEQECDPRKNCTNQETTKVVKQYMNVTNGQSTGMTKIFKENTVSISVIYKHSQI